VGLREKKAQRNLDRIVHEAMTLFSQNGYEQTTMESIAEAAELSPSTLYRCFPSKDLIVLASFAENTEKFTEILDLRPISDPVEEVLAEAIFAILAIEDERAGEALLVRSIIDQSPGARARLWDHLAEQHLRLGRNLAKRLHLKEDDLRVVLTARLTIMIVETSADIWRATGGKVPARSIAKEVMQLLAKQAVIVPRSTKSRLLRPKQHDERVELKQNRGMNKGKTQSKKSVPSKSTSKSGKPTSGSMAIGTSQRS
jgi:AcrR family transcriptional regulator